MQSIFENIFDIESYSKNSENSTFKVQEAIDEIRSKTNEKIQKINKEAFKQLPLNKKDNDPFIYLLDTNAKVNKFSKNLKINIPYLVGRLGATLILTDECSKKQEDPNKPLPKDPQKRMDHYVESLKRDTTCKRAKAFIIVPELSLIQRLFAPIHSIFDKTSWYKLKRELILHHEIIEAEEYIENRTLNGQIYIIHGGGIFQVGNHFSLLVLAKEAVVMNKFKHLKAINALRAIRQKFEYPIIYKATGVNLNNITKLTPDIIKKLSKFKRSEITLSNGKKIKLPGIASDIQEIQKTHQIITPKDVAKIFQEFK